jgi:hypothetical protein
MIHARELQMKWDGFQVSAELGAMSSLDSQKRRANQMTTKGQLPPIENEFFVLRKANPVTGLKMKPLETGDKNLDLIKN